jgi:PKD repeat protein
LGDATALFSWAFDNDPPSAYTANPFTDHTFLQRGTHKVTLYAKYSDSCFVTLVDNNYLVAAPAVNFTATPRINCTPDTVVFTDLSTAVNTTHVVYREWSFGNGSNN